MNDPKRLSGNHTTLMGPPRTPSRILQSSPQYGHNPPFSPDIFNTPTPTFTTAPTYPQQRLFWDSGSQASDYGPFMGPYQSPYDVGHLDVHGSQGQHSPIPFALSSPQALTAIESHDLPGTHRSILPSSHNFTSGTSLPGPFHTSPRVPHTRAEESSQFLSSPARRFGGTENPTTGYKRHSITEKPAYYHQIEEARREKEVERARRIKARRSFGVESTASIVKRPISPALNNRPGIRRSLTHSGVGDRKQRPNSSSQVTFAEPQLSSSAIVSKTGRSSPSKVNLDATTRARPASRSNTSKRTSLTFTIDEEGRAKTIITRAADPINEFMDLDDEESGSEHSSVDESDFHGFHSQHNSFIFSEGDDLLSTAYAPDRRAIGHSKNDSYSTIASSNSARQSSRTSSEKSATKPFSSRVDASHAKSALPSGSRFSYTNNATLGTMNEEDAAIERSSGKGDAQQALRAIMNNRPRSTSSQDTNRTRLSSTQFHSSPPIQQHNYSAYNESPTTITDPDLSATPSTDRDSLISNGSTRCVCSSASPDGQFMIQCESCSKWLHAGCVGVDSRKVPEVYICIFCAQTPMRHGRIREPPRIGLASPLAHKSSRYR